MGLLDRFEAFLRQQMSGADETVVKSAVDDFRGEFTAIIGRLDAAEKALEGRVTADEAGGSSLAERVAAIEARLGAGNGITAGTTVDLGPLSDRVAAIEGALAELNAFGDDKLPKTTEVKAPALMSSTTAGADVAAQVVANNAIQPGNAAPIQPALPGDPAEPAASAPTAIAATPAPAAPAPAPAPAAA